MKKLFTVFVILLSNASLFSQNASELKLENYKDKFALLFCADRLNRESYKGGIGWKKWRKDKSAFVCKLNVSLLKEEKDKTSELSGSKKENQKYEFSFGIMKHKDFVKRFSPFIGGQVGASYEKMMSKISSNFGSDGFSFYPSLKNEIKQQSISLSLQMVFGIEYFITDTISFSGQYNFGGYYRFGTEKTVSNILDAEQDISEVYFGIWSSSLILSVYF